MQIEPIARVRSPYPTKFGVPRQPGLVDAPAEVVFEPAYRNADAVRGLDGFDYVWLLWSFSHNDRAGDGVRGPREPTSACDPAPAPACGPDETPAFRTPSPAPRWSPTVRPPILGGTRRMGVFATRSSFRPNGLALSCVRLLGVDLDAPAAPVLRLAGVDMADGTPVFDVKPYLPYVDARPEARAGWIEDARWPLIERVEVPPAELARLPEQLREPLVQLLRQDPRPAYARRGQEAREFWVPFGRYAAWFRVAPDADGEPKLTVTRVARLTDAEYGELRATGSVAAFER